MIIASLTALFFNTLDKLLFWGLDGVLQNVQVLLIRLDDVNTYRSVIISYIRVFNYFVPPTHQIAIITTCVAMILLKIFASIFHAVRG